MIRKVYSQKCVSTSSRSGAKNIYNFYEFQRFLEKKDAFENDKKSALSKLTSTYSNSGRSFITFLEKFWAFYSITVLKKVSEATVMDVDVELQEVRERLPETHSLVVSDADRDLNDDVEASVDEKTW